MQRSYLKKREDKETLQNKIQNLLIFSSFLQGSYPQGCVNQDRMYVIKMAQTYGIRIL